LERRFLFFIHYSQGAFHMLKRVLLIVLSLLLVVLPVMAQDGDTTSATKAIDYLLSVQNEDGGFSNGMSPESDISTTADVIIASVAAGEDPNAFFTGDMFNPFTFLGIQAEDDTMDGAGQYAKVLIAVIAAGKDPTAFGGHNLIDDLLAMQNEGGSFGSGSFDHCLAILALQNAGAELPGGTVDVLVSDQNEDGGWGFMADQASDTNTTALCLQALASTDQTDAVQAGLEYLRAIQNEDGGWPYQNPSDYGTTSDANSTALVTQALIAAGEDLATWNNPQEWLQTLQLDNGGFVYQEGMTDASLLATVAVVPALAGVSLNAWVPVPEEE
jgi:prenyltransferase beta subunit